MLLLLLLPLLVRQRSLGTVGSAGGHPVVVVGPEGLQLTRPSLAPCMCAEALASWRSFLVHEVQVSGKSTGGASAVGPAAAAVRAAARCGQ